MTRHTIDFGIDLGTTNSAIAVLVGTEPQVIRNNYGHEYTPSVVRIDARGRVFVGQDAKGRLTDQGNTKAEFKLSMGTTRTFDFVDSGRSMTPVELSAEVLKSLRRDVEQRMGEQLEAAVVTVPAAFEIPQCKATEEAARLAGLSHSPLLQEPVAAALAYGFQTDADGAFWMVYDIGGGTFDAAIVNMRDGVFQVVNHGGDNHLGGKRFDEAIVDSLVAPVLRENYSLEDFDRGNARWNRAYAWLKKRAEEVKIHLSQLEACDFILEEGESFEDDEGKPVELELEITRRELETIMEPFIEQSLNICRKTLAEKRLAVDDLERVILVGGPTLAPFVRQAVGTLGDGVVGRLAFSIDPLTVVARGAAVFAGTQRVTRSSAPVVEEGVFLVDLDYKPVGTDVEPLVGGRVHGAEANDLSDFTIEFINTGSRPEWRSGLIGLSPDGVFMADLWAEKGRLNEFAIELRDAAGRIQRTEPATFTYTVGNVFTDPPLTHSIGIELADGKMRTILEKGTALPARGRVSCTQAYPVKAGDPHRYIRVPVYEGMHARADRNVKVGCLEVSGAQLTRDVPAGTEVEVTLALDRSRLVHLEVYVPLLDKDFEAVFNAASYGDDAADLGKLSREIEKEKERLEEVRDEALLSDVDEPVSALRRIDGERMVQEIEQALEVAQTDGEAAVRCANRLRDLKAAIDEVEDALAWPKLVQKAEGATEWAERLIEEFGSTSDQRRLEKHRQQVQTALDSRDPDALEQAVDELHSFVFQVLDRKGILQLWFFESLEERQEEMADPAAATRLLARGRRAISNGDLDDLRAVNRALAGLLPDRPAPPDASTILLR